MQDLSNIKFDWFQCRRITHAAKYFRKIDILKFAKKYENEILKNKINLLPVLIWASDFHTELELTRVSINKNVRRDNSNNRLLELKELKYPPEEVKAKIYYNRANFKNQSVFYGGFGAFQGLFENPPGEGDLFTVSTWKQKNNTNLHCAQIFHDEKLQRLTDIFKNEWNDYLNQTEKLNKKTEKALYELLSLITFFFMRPVDSKNSIEYILSAYLANQIFEKSSDPKVEAIIYPSVPMGYISKNFAIIPEVFDIKFDFVKSEEFAVRYKPKEKNQWIYQKISKASETINGKLIWVDNVNY